MSAELTVNVAATVEFLRAITPSGGFGNVTAIDAHTAGCTGVGYEGDSLEAARAFIAANVARNLYWTVNGLAGRVDKKPGKSDITEMRYAHLDLDDPSEAALIRIRTASPPPSLVIFSGGGYGAFWRLAEPVKVNGNLEALEAVNKRLIEIFGAGKGTQNIDRLMRLPFTVNHLNEKKRRDGRQPAETYVVEHHPERLYTLEELRGITCEGAQPQLTAPMQETASSGSGESAADRSRDLLKKVAADVRAGKSDQDILTAHRGDPHARDQADPDRAIRRCIERARHDAARSGAMDNARERNPLIDQTNGETADDTAGMEPGVRELVTTAGDAEIILPNDYIPFPYAARRLFERMARRREAFVRNGVVLELKGQQLDVMTAAKLRSRIDAHGRRVKAVKTLKHGGLALLPKRCAGETAEALLVTREAEECLPPIEMVSTTPVLVERDGQLATLGGGYHEAGGGILVLGGEQPQIVGIDEATAALLGLLDDFRFATEADKSRAVAMLVGPALRAGGLLPGHALMNCVEADQSQTGKGYFVRLQQAIYGEVPVPVGRRNGGVGSLDEDIGGQILRAKMFVLLDNVRGTLDSEYLEAILTAEDDVVVRLPHRSQVTVNVRRMTLSITSNGMLTTRDLGNRLLITRLLKCRPENGFKTYPEGGLLEHVRARQPYYLGAVHAVLREWFEAGKPRADTEHSFREWVGALEWIVRGIFGLRPLLEGHDAAKERVGNPALAWLRAVALSVVKARKEGHIFGAAEIAQMCADETIELPGFKDAASDEERRQQVGRLLARCFAEAERGALTIDTVHVKRFERVDPLRAPKLIRRYQFWRGDSPPAAGDLLGGEADA